MTFSSDIESFLRDYLKEVQEQNAAIFAGAGLSMGSRAIDWSGLLRDFALELKLDVAKEPDLVLLTQFYLNHVGQNRSSINKKLLEEFHHGLRPNDNHRIIARLPISTYWTTNYDKLIELSLADAGKIVDVKHSVLQLAHTVPGRDVTVYKMHGDVDLPQHTILSKDEYERYHVTHGGFLNALSGDLTGKTFLFLGFSFTDPNLDYVLSRIRIMYRDNQRRHYCIFREVKKKENETDKEFLYRQIRQDHVVKDLQRFNIQVLIVNEFEDITAILTELERRFKQRTVCISGSAAVYDPYTESQAHEFLNRLASELVKRKHKIVSGFGTGVGIHIINGALKEVYENEHKSLKDELILRPFPVGSGGDIVNQYREDMLAYAGIAIFVFGNKMEGSNTVHADGMRKEFAIGERNGMLLLPVGCTGHVARELWEHVWKNYDKYYPGRMFEPVFRELGQSHLDINRALELILTILPPSK